MNQTIRTKCFLSTATWVAAHFLFAASQLSGQEVKAAAGTPRNLDDDVFKLSKFTVSAENDSGYRATDTLAGTHIRTNINDIGSALTIITKQFLEDIGASGNTSLLTYTLGTEVGGIGGNFAGAGDGVALTERNTIFTSDAVTRVRGLSSADNTRDLYLTDIPWDTYNVERVEMQRGPNAILFGLGSPGGVVNASIKQAGFKDLTKVQARFGRHESLRGALDINRVLIKDGLALRVNALLDDAKYQQKPAYKNDRRLAAALRFDPSFLNRGSAHTSFRINSEWGDITGNNPRSLAPADRITPWFETGTTTVGGKVFNNLNKFTGDFRYANAYFANVPGSGFLVASSPNYRPGIQDANNGNYAFFDMQTAGSGAPTGPYYVPRTNFTETFGLAPNGTVDGTIRGLFNNNKLNMVSTTSELARKLGVPFAFAYKNKSITDPSIFDFYNRLIDGPNKTEERKFRATNLTLTQTFWKNRIGIEAVYDQQDYRDVNAAYFYGLGTGDAAITIDVNTHLPDQTLNPNVGRPMLVQRAMNGGFSRTREREVTNLTAYLELEAADFMKASWLTKLVGRHILTGAVSDNRFDQVVDSPTSAAVTSNGFGTPANDPLNIRRELAYFSYLGPDARGQSSAAGLNLSNVQNSITLGDNNIVYFDSHWNRPTSPSVAGYVNPGSSWVNPFNNQILTQSENPANYVGWTSTPTSTLSLANGDRDLLTFQSSKTRSEVSSKYFVWQGYLWDGLVVPMFGYREDTAKSYAVVAPVLPAGYVDKSSPGFDFPASPDALVKGETKSYSLVVHAPKFIRRMLPAGMNVSLLYNKSSNFQPLAGRTDILDNPIGSPSGNTEDYGIVISAFDERVRLKINKFKTSLTDSSYQPQTMWWTMTTEKVAWVKAKQYEAGLTGDPLYEGAQYNYGSIVSGVFVQSAADRQRQQQHVQAVLSQFAPELWRAWGVSATKELWEANDQTATPIPPGMNGTVDSVSRGYEFELNVQPAANWNIAVNAARTEAVRSNVGGQAMNDWFAARNKVWNGTAGELLQSGTGTATISDYWNNFLSGFQLDKLLEGSSAPEIRRWRFNAVSNYRFTKGKWKGFNVGGAYRWQDRVVLGYPSIKVTIDGREFDSFDIPNPYHGPKEDAVDVWAGYTRKLRGGVQWKIQLNVQNALGEKGLVPINAQPDGGPAAFRIKYGPSWFVTNSFEF